MSDDPTDWIGQGLAVLMVGGLIALVVWFATTRDDGPTTGLVGDAGPLSEVSDAALDGSSNDDGVPPPVFTPTGHHTALFGAVVESSAGLPLQVGRGCILAVAVGPGPVARGVRLICEGLETSAEQELLVSAVVEELRTDLGAVYRVRYTSPAEEDRGRVSIDTSRGTLLVMDGAGRARLRVDETSVPRPGRPFTETPPTAPAIAPEADASCSPVGQWVGAVLLADETLEPLTLGAEAAGGEPVVSLFDARAEPVTEIAMDCLAGTATMRGATTRYEGRFGPGHATVLGRVSLAGERGLFWLRRQP